jgi:hypothetical protein
MDYFFEPHHQDVILVRDAVLAAALFSRDHRALETHQDPWTKDFYCLFAISRRLRKDIRDYYTGDLTVKVIDLNREFDAMWMHIADTESYIEHKKPYVGTKANG